MITVHGVAMRVHGVGLLIQGPAGSGKSRLALELLARGHALVADDAVQIERRDEALHACAEPDFRPFLLSREAGVIDVPRLFGAAASCAETRLDLVLRPGRPGGAFESPRRLPLAGLELPLFEVARLPDAAVVTEILCRQWLQRRAGHDAAAELEQRQSGLIRQRSA